MSTITSITEFYCRLDMQWYADKSGIENKALHSSLEKRSHTMLVNFEVFCLKFRHADC